jgi:GT2 family glycosyltransferase
MEETLAPQPLPDPPKVSAVIVTRNQAAGLRRCLTALHQSSMAEHTQIIVVDNASNDGSNLLQDDFEKITYLRLPKNFGWTKAANIALRSTQAESILFVDPRVSLDRDAVSELAGAVTELSPAAASCPFLTTPDEQPAPILRKLPVPADLKPSFFAPAEAPTEPLPVEFPGLYAFLIRKSFLKGMNFFDERYGETWADAEVAMQVKRANRRILMLPAARGTYYAEDAPPALPASLLDADFEQGAATYLGKHYGGGMGRRISAALGALGTLRIGLFTNLVSGQKIDGTQE